nr:unnamed protein product [Callosobruchus chinensis]
MEKGRQPEPSGGVTVLAGAYGSHFAVRTSAGISVVACREDCKLPLMLRVIIPNTDRRDERLRNARLRRALREHNPVMDLSDNEFKAHYRLTKDLFLQLCEEISPYLPRPRRRTAISVKCKVLTTLSFYATGSYQKPIGMSYLHGLSQSGVSNTVREVTNAFNHPNILRRFIRFPQTVQKRQAIINGFSNKFQIPGCLGCIDCTHVALVRPNENEERFFNRKHYHSRNVQIMHSCTLNEDKNLNVVMRGIPNIITDPQITKDLVVKGFKHSNLRLCAGEDRHGAHEKKDWAIDLTSMDTVKTTARPHPGASDAGATIEPRRQTPTRTASKMCKLQRSIWESFRGSDICRNLSGCMQRRLQACIDAEGDYTKYCIHKKDEERLENNPNAMTPPYMCELNPIELAWAKLKFIVRSYNITGDFNITRLKEITVEAMSSISMDYWKKICQHVKDIEDQFWEHDRMMEETEPIIINLNTDDDSETESDDPDEDNDERSETGDTLPNSQHNSNIYCRSIWESFRGSDICRNLSGCMQRRLQASIDAEDRRDERLRNARLRRALREHNPVMDLSDNEFKAHYRLTKDLFLQLCEEISPYLPRPRRRTAISVKCKVLTTLSFYATGSYQKPIGMSYLHGLSQSGVSNTVREVTNAFNHPNILRRFIRFPQTVQKRQAIINGFSNKFQIPGCLGCIDCTHVALVRPNENEERFFNRKHYHSRNVQIICDSNLNVLISDIYGHCQNNCTATPRCVRCGGHHRAAEGKLPREQPAKCANCRGAYGSHFAVRTSAGISVVACREDCKLALMLRVIIPNTDSYFLLSTAPYMKKPFLNPNLFQIVLVHKEQHDNSLKMAEYQYIIHKKDEERLENNPNAMLSSPGQKRARHSLIERDDFDFQV